MSNNPCDCVDAVQWPFVPFVPFSPFASSAREFDEDEPFIFNDPFESLPLLISLFRLGNVGI